MNQPRNNKSYYEINLLDLYSIIFSYKLIILFITTLGAIFSIFYALNISKIYVSEAKLMPANIEFIGDSRRSTDSLGGVLSVFSPGSNIANNDAKQAVAFIRSRTFFKLLYDNDQFIKDFFASSSFDKNTNSILYDSNKLDSKGLELVDKISFEEAYYYFHNSFFSINENLESGLYKIQLEHISPTAAAYWLRQIIDSINLFIKNREIEKTKKKIKFYEEQLQINDVASVRNIFLNSLQKELQVIAFSASTNEFAFSVIDYPFIPEKPSKPSRTIIVILGTILSFLTITLIVILYNFLINTKKANN
jgi:LPS O-antigen subunit length determinant protein (WzzB/FepE family)